MYSYIVAKIISINKKSITVENNYIGYVINVIEPNVFELNKIKKIYLYKHVVLNNKNSFIEEYYGFNKYDEKEFFINCIAINGIGPKTAINILKNDLQLLKKLISNKDLEGLEQLNGITKKYSYLLVEYLSDHYLKDKIQGFDNYIDVIGALKTLGYNQEEINFAINNLIENKKANAEMELSDLVSDAIKLIASQDELKINKA